MPRLYSGFRVAALCAIAFSFPASMVAQTAATVPPSPERPQTSIEALPDSPGTTWAKSQNAVQGNSSGQTNNPEANPQRKQDEKLQRPVGTAAAEAPKVSGVTAAQPAGAAIAPAKQRRVRTLVLKVGAIVGAGVAIGTVVGLAAATPSNPPGAHARPSR
jgi:hypothetical protein